jgi:methyl-accepting chemotaxis protein
MRSINDLRFAHKFLILGVLAAAMMVVPSALLMRGDLQSIHEAEEEVHGLAPSGSLLKLVQLTQQHRGLSALYLGGKEKSAAPRLAKQREINAAIETAVVEVRALNRNALSDAAQGIARDWRAVASAVDARSVAGPESFARHTALVTAQRNLVLDIARATGIATHRQPAGYYLQLAVLEHLPALAESLGQMRARGTLLLTNGQGTPDERAAIASLAGAMKDSLDHAKRALAQAVAQDAQLGRTLNGPIGEAVQAGERGLALVDSALIHSESLNHPPAQYFAETTQVIDTQFKLVDAAFAALKANLDQNAAHTQRRVLAVLAVLALLGALGAALILSITRSTVRAISRAVDLAKAVADGDLTQRVASTDRDEVGDLIRALDRMTDSLSSTVGAVRANAECVASASQQIAHGNSDLSQRTEEQASALAQTASSMEQLGATVRQNADSAGQADALTQAATESAVRGGEIVQGVVTSMRSIDAHSQRVTDIVGVIDGIAFQTNILALNAAVEAARAGDHGRGFAVVASEVRLLASRSAEAAREIKQLIAASVDRVQEGRDHAEEAGEAMKTIVSAVERVAHIMSEIRSASEEQRAGVSQIGLAVHQMDATTQQNAALVEQSAAAAESLHSQAAELVKAVNTFRLAA